MMMVPLMQLDIPATANVGGANYVDGQWRVVDAVAFEKWWYSSASSIYCISLWTNEGEQEQHFFRLPRYGEGYWSQTIRSMTYFRQREYIRYESVNEKVGNEKTGYGFKGPLKYPKPYAMIRDASTRAIDHMSAVRMKEKHDFEMPECAQFFHASLYDLYIAIGYDYKRQRYDPERWGKQPSIRTLKKRAK